MPTYPIIIIDSPSWATDVTARLEAAGYTVKRYGLPEGGQAAGAASGQYITRLADDLAALILVDGALPDWQSWATLPRTSPATRRIPVVVIGSPDALALDAKRSGVDRLISEEALLTTGAALAEELARIPDSDLTALLDCQCRESMPEEGLLALEKFNAGEYYEQHDRFEHLWMVEQGPVRDLYRAILQVGIAYYQVTRGNLRSARKMLLRSIQWLALLPDVCQGVDVAQLRRDADAVRAELDRVGDDGAAQFNMSLLKGINTPSQPTSASGA